MFGLIDQHIARLQVAVNYALGMRGIERGGQLTHNLERALERQRMVFLDEIVEVFALHVGHGDELDAAYVAQVVNAQNILVRNAAGQQQFLLEALHRSRITGQFRAHQLQRYRAIQIAILGFVDLAHPSFANNRFDEIARPELCPRRDFSERHCGLCRGRSECHAGAHTRVLRDRRRPSAQVRQHLSHGRIALVGMNREAFHDHVVQVPRN